MTDKIPPVLTHGEVLLLTDNPHFSAEESRKEQRDADVEWFLEDRNKDEVWKAFIQAGIQQAKAEGTRKVVEELRLRGDMSMNFPFSNIRKEAWQAFEKKVLEGEQKPFDDCPNDCENFPHCANTEGCLERLQV